MGLFGNDDQQDERLDDLEVYLRGLTEVVQQNALDVSQLRVNLISIRAQIENKLSSDDVDPAIIALNEQIGVARVELEKTSQAASESWSTLQAGAQDALAILRTSVAQASDRIEQELRD